jgi:tRNA-binding protein
MIAIYNKHLNDVLMLITGDDQGQKLAATRQGRVTKIVRQDTGAVVGWNFFEASTLLTITGNGQVQLSDQDVAQLNAELAAVGFSDLLVNDQAPKFVVGEITALVPHPDSDHLNIAQVKIAENQTVQIVAGAPNARLGLKTIVVLPGALMPNGSLIFAGQLRGVASFGMMASPRELGLPNAPQRRGIIELSADEPVGTAFDPVKHWPY